MGSSVRWFISGMASPHHAYGQSRYAPLKDTFINTMIAIGLVIRLFVAVIPLLKSHDPNLLLGTMTSVKLAQMLFTAMCIPHTNKRVTEFVCMQALFGIVSAWINKTLSDLSTTLQYLIAILILLAILRVLNMRCFVSSYANSYTLSPAQYSMFVDRNLGCIVTVCHETQDSKPTPQTRLL